MLDYCSIILTVHAALWVGGRRVHWYMSAVSMESSTKERERERERGEDAEKCEHGEGHGRRGAVKKH